MAPIVRHRRVPSPLLRSIAAGVALAASMPPWGWWPLALVGIILLDHLLAGAPWRSRLLRGAVVGWSLFVPTILWITQLTGPGYVIAVLLLGGLVGVFMIAVPPNAGRRPALIGAWVLCESLRGAWPFGGVPLSLLAVGQATGPLVGLARIGGVLLVGGATAALGLALSASLRGERRTTALLAVPVLLLGLTAELIAPRGHETGRTVDVAFVQGGGEQGTRAIHSDATEVFRRHIEASAAVPDGMDLVLWPENVVDTKWSVQDDDKGAELLDLAERLDAPVLVGTVEGVDSEHFRNSQQVVRPDGTWGDRYVKVQRVPFGEWVPFRSLIERFAPDTLAPRDATVSHQSGLMRTDPAPLATVISWEVFFGHRARSGVRAGGEILYNPTNGSTYTGTFVQTQQIAHSRLRAIENGRWMVQVAPTGFSAFVSPEGEVHQRTGTRERAVRTMRDLPRRSGNTWYVSAGDLPPRIAAVALLVAGLVLDRRSRTGTGTTPPEIPADTTVTARGAGSPDRR